MIINTLWYNNTAATYRDENGKLVCVKIMHMQSLIMKSYTVGAKVAPSMHERELHMQSIRHAFSKFIFLHLFHCHNLCILLTEGVVGCC